MVWGHGSVLTSFAGLAISLKGTGTPAMAAAKALKGAVEEERVVWQGDKELSQLEGELQRNN